MNQWWCIRWSQMSNYIVSDLKMGSLHSSWEKNNNNNLGLYSVICRDFETSVEQRFRVSQKMVMLVGEKQLSRSLFWLLSKRIKLCLFWNETVSCSKEGQSRFLQPPGRGRTVVSVNFLNYTSLFQLLCLYLCRTKKEQPEEFSSDFVVMLSFAPQTKPHGPHFPPVFYCQSSSLTPKYCDPHNKRPVDFWHWQKAEVMTAPISLWRGI